MKILFQWHSTNNEEPNDDDDVTSKNLFQVQQMIDMFSMELIYCERDMLKVVID